MIRNSVVSDGITSKKRWRTEDYLRVDIPFEPDERRRFEAFIKAHGYVKGRFVRNAILKAMDERKED